MKTQHNDVWGLPLILEKLRDTECSLLRETRFFDSNTLLHVAASLGHDQIVEAILSKQQCQELLTAKNSTGDLPLHVAVNARHLPIVQQLLKSSYQCQELLTAKNSSGDLPLHVAVNAEDLPMVQLLLMSSDRRQELLTAKNSNGDLPLHLAVNARHQYMVEQLLKSSDQCQELLTAKNSNGDLPLHLAVNVGHLHIVQQLVKSSYQCQELLMAQNSNVDVACKLLKEKNEEGITPLDLALIKKKTLLEYKYHQVAEFLIETGRKAENGELMEFESESYFKIDLSDAEMKPDSQHKGDKGGKGIALSDAKMRNASWNSIKPKLERFPQKSEDKVTSMDPELYKVVKSKDIHFIRNKAEDTEHPALSDKTPELNTILHLAAASSDNKQFVGEILEIELCRQFVTEKNSNGDLPLHVAASAGNMQMVELLAASVPQMEKNMEENTPLHLALIKKFQVGANLALKAEYNKVAKFLVENCPEVSFYPNRERKSPLYLAAEGGDEELMRHMITTNCLPYGKSIVHAAIYYLMTTTNLPYGKSIAHAAIYGSFTARKKDMLDTVLESLPNDILTVKDDEGMTPLTYAASIGYLSGIKSLLRKTTIPCVYGEHSRYYPIHIATRKGHIKLLCMGKPKC
ncbi:ankyrin-1-like [Quercus lobata]|uniref:ankyrin-1-like n=1 Tax=Quercus lobata TaxID=97700 RepID=UPI001246D432|nr:ankyrin-1-like [Quercus lobata]